MPRQTILGRLDAAQQSFSDTLGDAIEQWHDDSVVALGADPETRSRGDDPQTFVRGEGPSSAVGDYD